MSSSVRYRESSKWDFLTKSRKRKACPRSAGTRNLAGGTTSVRYDVAQGELLHVHPLRGIKHARLRTSETKSHEQWVCPCPFDTRTQLGRNSSVRYKVMRKENLFSFIRYKESSWRNFVHPVRSHVKRKLVLAHPGCGIKQAVLRLSSTKSRERTACPHLFGTRNKAGRTSYIWNDVARTEDLSSSVQYEETIGREFISPL